VLRCACFALFSFTHPSQSRTFSFPSPSWYRLYEGTDPSFCLNLTSSFDFVFPPPPVVPSVQPSVALMNENRPLLFPHSGRIQYCFSVFPPLLWATVMDLPPSLLFRRSFSSVLGGTVSLSPREHPPFSSLRFIHRHDVFLLLTQVPATRSSFLFSLLSSESPILS